MRLIVLKIVPAVLALGLVCLPNIQAFAKVSESHMAKSDRSVALPEAMQGIWFDIDDGNQLTVAGGEVTYAGKAVDYDYKLVESEDGALTVSLKVEDSSREDAFQRENVTELVITPDGEFHAYNVNFDSQFERAK
ncbi:MAG TPA: hypothetical protein VL393_10910 [Candidatus Binataceae bacterium]|nr:hypothetical protein [Candidatus Binataceae bacterium]